MAFDFLSDLPRGPAIGICYTAASAGAHSMIQAVKMARRDVGARRLPTTCLWIMATLFSGTLCAYLGKTLFAFPLDEAIAHGVLCGLLYTTIMAFLYGWLREHKPDVYNRLRVPERRRYPGQVVVNPQAPEPPKTPEERTHRPVQDPLDDTYTNLPGL